MLNKAPQDTVNITVKIVTSWRIYLGPFYFNNSRIYTVVTKKLICKGCNARLWRKTIWLIKNFFWDLMSYCKNKPDYSGIAIDY